MKKLLSFMLALLPVMANATIKKVGNMYFDLYNGDGEAHVVKPPLDEVNGLGEIVPINFRYSGDIVIPDRFSYDRVDYTVTTISSWAFWGADITSVTIPNTVKSIGVSAFMECKNLTSVTIPSSVNYIYKDAFWGCVGLKFVTFQDGVKNIEEGAFKGCTSLQYIEMPNSVKKIGEEAFMNCAGLTAVTIPSSLTSVGTDAFKNCDLLTILNISDLSSWCSIKWGNKYSNPLHCTLRLCSNYDEIKDLVIPDDVTAIAPWAFVYCRYLKSLTIPSSVTTIGNEAFRYSFGLTSVSIPNSVTKIGNGAFEDTGLESVLIPVTLTSIGKYAFGSLRTCSSIVVENGNPNYDSRGNCNALIESSTNTLLTGCGNTIIPNDVTTIGEYAFHYCRGLTSITIPNSVITIKEAAFEYSNIESVIIPSSVTSIGEDAYKGCDYLTSIKVDEKNTKYDSRDNCNAIIESSSNKLIFGCKTTIIPTSVTSIGEKAFSHLDGLKSVIIPASVTSIGKEAFCTCRGLTAICCLSIDPPSCYNNTFDSVDKGKCIVWVPKGCVESYKEATGWKDFQNIKEVINGDYDLDGKVDGEDVSTLATSISNASADTNIGDINGDNEVNVADVVALINRMGYYLVGDYNGWDTTDKTYAFTKLNDGKTWEITIKNESASCFKIVPASAFDNQDTFWSNLLCAETDRSTDSEGIMVKGDRGAWLLEGANSYTIRIVPSEMTFQIIAN